MSFANLSFWPTLFGLVAIAGALFALQRLRVRHRDLRVPTTMFWQEAVEEARARTLVERFRHLWAYLLVLVIAGAMWLAIADPETGSDGRVAHHVWIDASAGMAAGDRFAQACDAAAETVRSLPRGSTTVHVVGARASTVLMPGESVNLLARRLEGVRPVAAPSGVARHMRDTASDPDQLVHAWVFGGPPFSDAVRACWPENLSVERFPCAFEQLRGNRAFAALAVTEAASGQYDCCDLFVETRGPRPGPVFVRIDAGATTRLDPDAFDGGARYEWRDVPCSGGLLEARIDGADPVGFDDVAELRLPERRRIRVRVTAAVGPALRRALAADAAIELVAGAPWDVVVRQSDESLEGPSIAFGPIAEDDHTFVVVDGASIDSAERLITLLPELGLDQIDAMSLADAAARPISIGAEVGTGRSVRVWDELLTERFDFTRSRAFPLFVASSVRWLARESDWHEWIAAGEPAGFAATATTEDGHVHASFGASFVPGAAGAYRTDSDDAPFVAALLDTRSVLTADDVGGDVHASVPGAPADWSVVLAVVALLLLCVEWGLHRTGRMP